MHWWSFLDLHAKIEIFLFDSFGFEGFNNLSSVMTEITQQNTLWY